MYFFLISNSLTMHTHKIPYVYDMEVEAKLRGAKEYNKRRKVENRKAREDVEICSVYMCTSMKSQQSLTHHFEAGPRPSPLY